MSEKQGLIHYSVGPFGRTEECLTPLLLLTLPGEYPSWCLETGSRQRS
jgi:hypothetical protein